MLVIHPDECIDCGVCVPEVPGRRYQAGHRAWPREVARVSTANTRRSGRTSPKKDMHKDARAYWDETGKFDKYFSAKPGEGD